MEQEKDFKSIDEIDAALAEEFGKVIDNKTPEETLPVIPEVPPVTPTQPIVETPVAPVVPTDEEKQNHAYAKMREESKKEKEARIVAEESLAKNKGMMTRLAKASGYDSVEEYEAALQEKLLETEAKSKGVDPKFMAEIAKKDEVIADLRAKEAKATQEVQLSKFVGVMEEAIKRNGLPEEAGQRIIEQFEKDGFTLDQLLAVPHYGYLIEGAIAPLLVAKNVEAATQKAKEGSVVTTTPVSAPIPPKGMKEILDAEMAVYAKQRGIPLD